MSPDPFIVRAVLRPGEPNEQVTEWKSSEPDPEVRVVEAQGWAARASRGATTWAHVNYGRGRYAARVTDVDTGRTWELSWADLPVWTEVVGVEALGVEA